MHSEKHGRVHEKRRLIAKYLMYANMQPAILITHNSRPFPPNNHLLVKLPFIKIQTWVEYNQKQNFHSTESDTPRNRSLPEIWKKNVWKRFVQILM